MQLFLWYLWKCDWIVPSWYYDTAINFRHLHHHFFGFCVIKTILRFCNAFCWNYKYLFSKINKFWAYLSVFMSIICQKLYPIPNTKLSQHHAISKSFHFSYCNFKIMRRKVLLFISQEKKFCIHLFFLLFAVCIQFIYSKWCRKT